MRSQWQIGSILGIPLYIDPSWLFIVLFLTLANSAQLEVSQVGQLSTILNWAIALLMSLLLFASVLLHELGHSLVALAQKIKVNSITLFLFGGIAAIERESKSPIGAFLVAIAGPVVSFCLFGLCFALKARLPLSSLWDYVLTDLGEINLALGIFNLIPGLPLDGGQMLKAIVWQVSGDRFKGVHWASQSGKLVGSFGIALGLLLVLVSQQFSGVWLALIGWFILRNANAYDHITSLQESLVKLVAADAMTRDFRVIDAHLSLREFAEEYVLRPEPESRCLFAAANGRYCGLIQLNDLQKIERGQWEQTYVRDIARPLAEIASAAEKTPLAKIIPQLEALTENWITILSPAGAVAGVIDRGDIVQAIATAHKLPISSTEIQRIKSASHYPDYLPLPEIIKGLESG